MSKKISTTVYLTEDEVTRLKRLNERTKVPVAEMIRQAIDAYLVQREKDQDLADAATGNPWPRLFLGGK